MPDLNEEVVYTVRENETLSVPVDATLSIEGQAADAAAVGRALDGKMDADAMHISVNGEEADNQGAILISGDDIPVSGTDSRKIPAALEAIDGKTGADIPVNSDEDAPTIQRALDAMADEIEGLGAVDDTLSEAGVAADAKAAGDAIRALQEGAAGNVKSVNGETPDENGNVQLDGIVKSVNSETPDANGNVAISSVSMADNLTAENAQSSSEAYIVRTTGGNASITDGDAWALRFMGNCVHTGYVAEVLNMTVEAGDEIEAEIDRDVFVTAVSQSGTITLTYTNAWSENPVTYGVTVTGTPVSGDRIIIVYVKEERGTIYPARPTGFVSTGWNLYDPNSAGVLLPKYSEEYGYRVIGTFSSVQWAPTETGTKQTLTVVNRMFNIPSTGYVFINGANAADTGLVATWSDWAGQGTEGDFEAYAETGVDLSAVMLAHFTAGLLSVGSVRDEIDMNTQTAISRIGRTAYDPDIIGDLVQAGTAYDADENWIYFVKETADRYQIDVDGGYLADDHGIERYSYADANAVPVWSETIYGANLKNKLERDVLTISSQKLSEEQQERVRTNIGAVSASDVEAMLSAGDGDLGPMFQTVTTYVDNVSIAANSATTTPTIVPPEVEGYIPLAVVGFSFAKASSSPANTNWCMLYRLWYKAADNKVYMSIRNLKTDAAAKVKVNVYMLYLRNS